jgi:ribosomal protein S8E
VGDDSALTSVFVSAAFLLFWVCALQVTNNPENDGCINAVLLV